MVVPVRALALAGVHTLVLTNAAGSLRPHLGPGHLLVIRDHIDLPGLAGRSPLVGPNDERWAGPAGAGPAGAGPRGALGAVRRAGAAAEPPAEREGPCSGRSGHTRERPPWGLPGSVLLSLGMGGPRLYIQQDPCAAALPQKLPGTLRGLCRLHRGTRPGEAPQAGPAAGTRGLCGHGACWAQPLPLTAPRSPFHSPGSSPGPKIAPQRCSPLLCRCTEHIPPHMLC